MASPLDPKFYTISDEPLPEGQPVDYRYLYDLMYEVAPAVQSLDRSFPKYPVSTIIEAIAAMRAAIGVNAAKYEQKAAYLDYAVAATLLVTLAALTVQLLVALRILVVAP